MNGACPCGGVKVGVAQAPDLLNSCDCTLCFRLGTLWGYFDPADVTVTGETKSFVRDDIEAWLAINFCPGCGATVSWSFLPPRDDRPRMGVNMRLFDPADLAGIPVKFSDGRNWNERPHPPAERRAPVPFAADGPF